MLDKFLAFAAGGAKAELLLKVVIACAAVLYGKKKDLEIFIVKGFEVFILFTVLIPVR